MFGTMGAQWSRPAACLHGRVSLPAEAFYAQSGGHLGEGGNLRQTGQQASRREKTCCLLLFRLQCSEKLVFL